MLDIISMIAFLIIFIGLPILLILIGGSNKTEEEQSLEDEEQMKYLKKYHEKKLNKKNKSRRKFDINNIHSVELNLLDGQVDIILRGLELYGFNLEYMLNSSDSSDEMKQEKMALLKYTYEQILASRAEQVADQAEESDNISNLSVFGKILANQSKENEQDNTEFKVG